MTFIARLEQDHTTGSMWLQTSRNGTAWSTIELRSIGEAVEIVDLLQDATVGKLFNQDHAFNCMIHDGGLCNCGANLRSTA